jgi:hypothetical protein
VVTVIVRDFAPESGAELAQRFGYQLGRGAFRTVYPFGRDKVVKFERVPTANIREWKVWCAVKDTDLAKYLCPIYSKSSDNRTLIQERCREVFENRSRRVSNRISEARWGDRKLSPSQLQRLYRQREQLNDQVYEFTREVMNAFDEAGINAYDLHEGNIGFDRNGNMIVIDYGNFAIRGEPWDNREDDDYCDCSDCRAERARYEESEEIEDSDHCSCFMCKEARGE